MINALLDVLAGLLGRRPPYLQVAALCLRGPEQAREVLVVSSLGTGRWILPKGWPMRGRSLAQAALREAWEEAGVKGKVSKRPVGRYTYLKEGGRGLPKRCEVRVFLIEVDKIEDHYPEAGRRKRRWVGPAEAAQMVAEPELGRMFGVLEANRSCSKPPNKLPRLPM